jgi:iron complex outermembrane receptor protein
MMMKFNTWTYLTMAAVGAPGVAMPAVAQSTTAASANSDPAAIVVTARRFEERLQDVPISISVFTPEQIQNRNIFNANDLGTYTPSLSTNSRYGAEKSTFAIRSFTQENGTAPSVGIYFADVAAPRAAGGTASGNGAGVGSFFDLANVQVLKGPQGTLFGRNTTGGAILLVPQKPTGRLEGYVEGTLGNYDSRRIQAVLNVPLMDTFRIRAAVDYNRRDGYLKNHSALGPDALGNTNYITARVSAVADLAPNLENYTIVSYSNSDTYGSLGHVVGCNRASTSPFARAGCVQVDRQAARGDGPWDVESDISDPGTKLEQWQIINRTTWQLSDEITLKNIASYAEFRETTAQNIDGDNLVVPSGLGAISGQPFQLIITRYFPGFHNAAQSTLTEELQLQGRMADGKFTWQAGGYYELSEPLGPSQTFTPVLLNCTNINSLQCVSYFGATAGALSSGSFSTRFRDIGIYAQATYALTNKLSLTGGIRYTDDRTSQRGQNLSIKYMNGANNPRFFCGNILLFPGTPQPGLPLGFGKELSGLQDRAQCTANFSQHSGKPTWLADVDYKPIDDLLLYAKYSRGYRAGGVNTNAIGFETWGPEKVDTYEIGGKFSFRGAIRGFINVAGFYNKFTDQQIQANALAKVGSGVSGVNAIINAGSSVIKGVEVDSSVNPIRDFRIDVGYSYLDTKLKSINVPAIDPNSPYASLQPTAVAGGVLSYSPKNRYTVTGTYTLPLASTVGKIAFGATFTHTDSQVASLATLAQYGVLPASNLLNVNVSWNSVAGRPLDLSFFMTNVANKAYPVAVASAYNSFGFETLIYNEPRIFGFRARYRFGGK